MKWKPVLGVERELDGDARRNSRGRTDNYCARFLGVKRTSQHRPHDSNRRRLPVGSRGRGSRRADRSADRDAASNSPATGGLALLLHNTPSSAALTLKGRALTVAIRGRKVTGLAVQVLRRGAWVRVALRNGHAIVPGGSLVQLRVTGRTVGRALVTGVAPMTG